MSMPLTPTAVRSRRVLVEGALVPATIELKNGQIVRIAAHDAPSDHALLADFGDLVVSPGVVDAHVHINEPGRTDWEGFETATRAAAAGGTTTVVDMPLNSIPVTTTSDALAEKARHAAGRCAVDHAFWGGVVPDNERDLEGLIERGIAGFKCFLVHSGVDDFPNVVEADLRRAMPTIARHGAQLLVHAELPGPIDEATAQQLRTSPDPRRYSTFLDSRPRASEDDAIAMMVRLCREFGCKTHIVHLSSSNALAMVEAARREGLPFTAETCPHYLTFAAEEIDDGATPFKCCPPIRERDNREALWDGLRAGTLSMIVSDHSPCTPALKLLEAGDFNAAWGGIAGLQLHLSAVWTEARARGFSIADVSRWTAQATASLAGLTKKGSIVVGNDADFTVWDPDASFVVDAQRLEHKNKVTPWDGRRLFGRVARTIVRGATVFAEGEQIGAPSGAWVRRQAGTKEATR